MNKLLIVLPILALLSLGAVFMVSQSDLKNRAPPTIGQWQQCYQTTNIAQCSDSTLTSAQVNQCNSAAYTTTQLVFPDAINELSACKQWYTFFQSSKTDAIVDQNDYYNSCFASSDALSAAKASPFYYSRIYAPQYITCAGLQA